MKDSHPIAPWIRRFLVEHITVEKNLSKNTQKSYRDTLTLLLPFTAEHKKVAIEKLEIKSL